MNGVAFGKADDGVTTNTHTPMRSGSPLLVTAERMSVSPPPGPASPMPNRLSNSLKVVFMWQDKPVAEIDSHSLQWLNKSPLRNHLVQALALLLPSTILSSECKPQPSPRIALPPEWDVGAVSALLQLLQPADTTGLLGAVHKACSLSTVTPSLANLLTARRYIGRSSEPVVAVLRACWPQNSLGLATEGEDDEPRQPHSPVHHFTVPAEPDPPSTPHRAGSRRCLSSPRPLKRVRRGTRRRVLKVHTLSAPSPNKKTDTNHCLLTALLDVADLPDLDQTLSQELVRALVRGIHECGEDGQQLVTRRLPRPLLWKVAQSFF